MLRAKVSHWASGDVVALEKDPKNTKRQELIADEIDRQPPEELAVVRTLTSVLVEELQRRQSQGPIGIDVGRLDAPVFVLAKSTSLRASGCALKNCHSRGVQPKQTDGRRRVGKNSTVAGRPPTATVFSSTGVRPKFGNCGEN